MLSLNLTTQHSNFEKVNAHLLLWRPVLYYTTHLRLELMEYDLSPDIAIKIGIMCPKASTTPFEACYTVAHREDHPQELYISVSYIIGPRRI